MEGNKMTFEGESVLKLWGGTTSRIVDNTDDEEQRLIQTALTGDRDAFDTLVERHWRKIASVAGRFFEDSNEVEDVVQETLIRAFRSLPSFRQDSSLQTWLIRITINVCKNRQGGFWRRRVLLAFSQGTEEMPEPSAHHTAETELLRGEWERTVHCAIGNLPEQYRLPIILHYLEELSGAEVASALNLTESVVWSRIYTGCRILRKRLTSWLES
jgi:RNA polymerase sigma-70 factor, ECF subfamily